MTSRRLVVGVVAVALLVPGTAAVADSPGAGLVRVNQLGYSVFGEKAAYLLSPAAAAGASFQVVDQRGRKVLTGKVGRDAREWNAAYQHVYQLDLSALRQPGRYRVKVPGVADASPEFRVELRQDRDSARDKGIGFFAAQRDGADVVPGSLQRKPSHLTDRAAQVYELPVFAGPDTDQTVGELKPIDGPKVDVEGGWFDAGDYLKFTHIAAYSDTMLWAAYREQRDRRLLAEARHGLSWLDKMWDERTKTLYIQVGVGSGNVEDTFVGDHDKWRLPEDDDQLSDPRERFLRNRPVFRAAAPGEPISPNLAGRTAAAFALAAQVEANPVRARKYLATAAQIFAQAKTTEVGQLTTSLPFAFYPESTWRDDLELGATQLALAAQRLRDPRANGWLKQAARWAKEYIAHETGDTLNLYDVSALAHADLIRAARGNRSVDVKPLVGDLRNQLTIGTRRAAADPFSAGARYDTFDAVPHTLGLAATARLYRQVTGDRQYDRFGERQLDWVYGTNPWGISFMVGVGENAASCPHHQIANLTGRPATGAVVNGPNSADLFSGGLGGHFEEMKLCPADGIDRFEQFTGRGSRYVDDVRSWQASEPADDFTAIAVFALSR